MKWKSFGIVLLAASAATAALGQPAAPAGFRGEFIAEVDSVGQKLVALANAVPAEKYGWRPGTGVRSVGEVYIHIALGNVYLPTFLGAKVPAGYSKDMDKTVTEKAKIIETLKNSLENVKSVAMNTSDADLEKKVKIFGGREVTEREVLMIILNHMHEHLGQSIAYARTNGVTPPWSETGEAPAKKS